MSNYFSYIDENLLKLGNVALEIGDTQLAISSHMRVLNKLKQYNGDRTAPMLLHNSLKKSVPEYSNKSYIKRQTLKKVNWKLSKTSYLKGIQCQKYLFLDKYKRAERTPVSIEKRELFSKGHSFEESFRRAIFPNGINIKEKLGMNFRYFDSYTWFLINNSTNTIFEGTVIENDVLIMVDIINKLENDTFDFYEIKLNSEMSEVIWNDLAIQYFVSKKRFGNKINTFNVALRENINKWKIINLKNELEEKINGIEITINSFKKTLKKNEPKIEIGNHCNNPYECEFKSYCKNK